MDFINRIENSNAETKQAEPILVWLIEFHIFLRRYFCHLTRQIFIRFASSGISQALILFRLISLKLLTSLLVCLSAITWSQSTGGLIQKFPANGLYLPYNYLMLSVVGCRTCKLGFGGTSYLSFSFFFYVPLNYFP